MSANLLREKLKDGETTWGPFFSFCDTALAEFSALLGWDFLIFDAEHGSISPKDMEDLSRACELRNVTSIIRTPGRERHNVNRYLDAGAHGIMFPMINSAADASEAIRVAKYPPEGVRGLAVPRASDFLLTMSAADYIANANDQILIIIQVETMRSVDSLEEILSLDGIDVVFLGSTDLSTDMGLCEQLDHPIVKGAIESVAAAVIDRGKILGTIATTPKRAIYVRDQLGARFIATDLTTHIADGCTSFLAAVAKKTPE
jgi:2-keto-3-deoxy-L-rhamnonate aldolase RhmA